MGGELDSLDLIELATRCTKLELARVQLTSTATLNGASFVEVTVCDNGLRKNWLVSSSRTVCMLKKKYSSGYFHSTKIVK